MGGRGINQLINYGTESVIYIEYIGYRIEAYVTSIMQHPGSWDVIHWQSLGK